MKYHVGHFKQRKIFTTDCLCFLYMFWKASLEDNKWKLSVHLSFEMHISIEKMRDDRSATRAEVPLVCNYNLMCNTSFELDSKSADVLLETF